MTDNMWYTYILFHNQFYVIKNQVLSEVYNEFSVIILTLLFYHGYVFMFYMFIMS
jgi:hypothetical protein